MFVFSHMTISHRATRSRSRSRSFSVETEDTNSSHNQVDDALGVAYDPDEVHLRGAAELPPIIPNEQHRPLLTNSGKMYEVDSNLKLYEVYSMMC
jgi:hypothetical protein